jgi:hypothetical protein
MQLQKYNSVLRSVVMSKSFSLQQTEVPQVQQISLCIKSAQTQDVIVNNLLLVALLQSQTTLQVTQAKKLIVNSTLLLPTIKILNFIGLLLPTLLQKAVDKVLAVNFRQKSNQLTFNFKAVDISSSVIRQL